MPDEPRKLRERKEAGGAYQGGRGEAGARDWDNRVRAFVPEYADNFCDYCCEEPMSADELKMRVLLESEKSIVENLTEAERYRYFLGRMQFLKYESGKENLLRSDCSGSVCLALLLATGCSIRVTADTLFRKYFTKKYPEDCDIQAVFFQTMYDRKMNGRIYREGEICHVAGVCGKDVVLNCVEPCSVLRSVSDMKPFYNANDYRILTRGLDRAALQEASDEGRDLFGADPEFVAIRKAIASVRG